MKTLHAICQDLHAAELCIRAIRVRRVTTQQPKKPLRICPHSDVDPSETAQGLALLALFRSLRATYDWTLSSQSKLGSSA